MSDTTMKGLSVVRREEEDNAIDANNDAEDFQANAEFPEENERATDAEDHSANADNLAEVGADSGYTNDEEN